MSKVLTQEEYIEQAHFFEAFLQRIEDSVSTQDILKSLKEELLATTKLPMAVDFLNGEVMHHGLFGRAMRALPHYFTNFQSFIMEQAEEEKLQFDQRIALKILQREAEYRASDSPQAASLFMYQFECVARNKLGYSEALESIAADPFYSDQWKDWINEIRHQLGTIDFTDLVYLRSEYAVENYKKQNRDDDFQPEKECLFGVQEGRIARANHGKDPLYMFTALQRHLGYPEVPKPERKPNQVFSAEQEARIMQLESRIAFLEAELKGKFDISQFYVDPKSLGDDVINLD